MFSRRAQRILVVGGLLFLAWLLHFLLCDWNYKYHIVQASSKSRLILVHRHRHPDEPPRTTFSVGFYSGLFTDARGDSRNIAVIFGVAVPLVLVGVCAYLIIGWRQQSRVTRGLCAECGYDLRGDNTTRLSKCPECGHQVDAGAAGRRAT